MGAHSRPRLVFHHHWAIIQAILNAIEMTASTFEMASRFAIHAAVAPAVPVMTTAAVVVKLSRALER